MNNSDKIVEEKVSSKLKEFYKARLQDYPAANKNDFRKLSLYKRFIEVESLQILWWESYIQTKYYLKEIARKAKTNNDFEEALHDWLKICINPQKDTNYDFYFEKNGLNTEEEVKNILFDQNGNIRETFKKSDWQIRLRKIADWYLKRYNIFTAAKIHKSIKLFLPRLWGAIFIGFLPLIVGEETWLLPLQLGWKWIMSLCITFLAITYGYLTIEAYNIIHRLKDALIRARFIFFSGFLISLIFSNIIVFIMGPHLVNNEFRAKGWICFGRLVFSENIIFFASAALLIGIFIQIFWEERTITEPL